MTKGNYEKEKKFQRQVQATMATEKGTTATEVSTIRSQDTQHE